MKTTAMLLMGSRVTLVFPILLLRGSLSKVMRITGVYISYAPLGQVHLMMS